MNQTSKNKASVNYQKLQEKLLAELSTAATPPTLLLHSCCAPCSSTCLELLSQYFLVTVLYYNPNISPEEEYQKRVEEQKRLILQLPTRYPVRFLEGRYLPEEFFAIAKGKEAEPEGGERCFACYRLRMEEAAKVAAFNRFDYFTTTLSLSPLKNADKINEIGEELSAIYRVKHLPSDFKKKDGYKRSIELSKEYGLYRQDFCGCVYSRR